MMHNFNPYFCPYVAKIQCNFQILYDLFILLASYGENFWSYSSAGKKI